MHGFQGKLVSKKTITLKMYAMLIEPKTLRSVGLTVVQFIDSTYRGCKVGSRSFKDSQKNVILIVQTVHG